MDPVKKGLWRPPSSHAIFSRHAGTSTIGLAQERVLQATKEKMQMQLQQFQMQLQEQQIAQGWAQINNVMMDKMEDNARADRELAVDTRQGDRELDIKASKTTGS